jgi:hypothetical protein
MMEKLRAWVEQLKIGLPAVVKVSPVAAVSLVVIGALIVTVMRWLF